MVWGIAEDDASCDSLNHSGTGVPGIDVANIFRVLSLIVLAPVISVGAKASSTSKCRLLLAIVVYHTRITLETHRYYCY